MAHDVGHWTAAPEEIFGHFARYRDITGDWPAFRAALEMPVATCVWAAQPRISPDALAVLLDEAGFSAAPIAWRPGAFRLSAAMQGAPVKPGNSWVYWAGLYHVQSEASQLPVRLLAPGPGDRVLDLCAAPGNKTSEIALALGNRGTVIANDAKPGRLAPLHQAAARLGLLNVSTVAMDGRRFPVETGPFDKILVDAPCSGEGGAGPARAALWRPDPGFRDWVTGVQAALLRRAIRLCRPGGRIVYSTCTYAPEENEAVVDRVLGELDGAARLVAPDLPDGLDAAPGLTEWCGQTFDSSLRHAVRLWPNRTGSDGFFAAVLERAPEPDADGNAGAAMDPPQPSRAGPADIDAGPMIAGLCNRYGLSPEIFSGLRFFAGARHIRVVAADHQPPGLPGHQASGFAFCRAHRQIPKPSTAAALAFGAGATRQVVDLDIAKMGAYRRRGQVTLGDTGGMVDGAVIVRHRGFALGTGEIGPSGIGPSGIGPSGIGPSGIGPSGIGPSEMGIGGDGLRLESLYPKAWTGG